MKTVKLKLLIVCVVVSCFMAAGLNALAADPQQSTAGPTPSLKVMQRDITNDFMLLGVPPFSPVIISGVPDYIWRHGCGPTAVGNVVGYYDTNGYNDLITGDANSQTNDVNQAIASGGESGNPNPPGSEQHYEDYSCPEDPPPGPMLTDDYITQGRTPHADDCIADYQDTSKSTRNNQYGWGWSNDLGPSFVGYINQRNATYNPTYIEYSPVGGKALTWAVMTNEIDNNRPMVFLVDDDGDGATDHFVTVVGYDVQTTQYGFLDTWNVNPTGIRWETFQSIGNGPWSIWGGWALHLGQPGEITKWEQPPDTTYNGIDIRCDRSDGIQRTLADDFLCITTGPIKKVVLWGSWRSDIKGQIQKIHLSIHSDDPIGIGGTDPCNLYSKPDQLLWQKDCNAADFVETLYMDYEPEWWWDPTTGMPPLSYEHYGVWQYDITIDSNAFVQDGNSTNPKIYWLDAWVELIPDTQNPEFGWKTSSTHWNDDAVFMDTAGTWQELRYPPQHPLSPGSTDLSFMIITSREEPNEPIVKYIQHPDLFETGIDVDATLDTSGASQWQNQILADDFPCRRTCPITDIHIWSSWYHDELPMQDPNNLEFTLSIHKDIPVGDPCNPNDYSIPGELLWVRRFLPGQFHSAIEVSGIQEGYYVPCAPYYEFPGDTICRRYDFYIDPHEAFIQLGDPCYPVVYWLDVQARVFSQGYARFGWKTSMEHWNDDAVFAVGDELSHGPWQELRYPPQHDFYPQSIDLAFAITTTGNEPNMDFGDAPDGVAAPGYPTLLINNGARHIIDGVTFMGALVDAEGDGQPTANADGDDLNPPVPDDEDGVVIPPLMRGQAVTISVTASVPGALDAWIDFSADGSWAQAGDQIAAAMPLVAGANPVTFVVPATATLGQTYARFRFSTAGGLQPFGPASNGEVEDYAVFIEEPQLDFGDAPDPTYPTKSANNGANHNAIGVKLGALIDVEADGQPNASATGDDIANVDDEDGITNIRATGWANGGPSVTVTTTNGPGKLYGWIDWNKDGDWADAGEIVVNGVVVGAGPTVVPLTGNLGAALIGGPTFFSRWRIIMQADSLTTGYVGPANTGEVEDYNKVTCSCKGEVTGDGKVNVNDVIAINGWIGNFGSGRPKSIIAASPNFRLCADADLNGKINVNDAIKINGWIGNYGSGRPKSLPCPHNRN